MMMNFLVRVFMKPEYLNAALARGFTWEYCAPYDSVRSSVIVDRITVPTHPIDPGRNTIEIVVMGRADKRVMTEQAGY